MNAVGFRVEVVAYGSGIPCPGCKHSVGTISDVAPRFFETGSFPCGRCNREIDVWEASHTLARTQGASFHSLTSLGAQQTSFTIKLSRNELKEVDLSQHGVPEDATLLQVSFYPQRHDCCFPFVAQKQFSPRALERKIMVFGQPLAGNGQEAVVAASVTWVPSHDDCSESWIYLTEAFDAWASQRYWNVILPAYVALEIALMRLVKAAMERVLSKARIAAFGSDLTSSMALNVILPLLCDSSNVKRLPDPIHSELNGLRTLRNKLVHDGLRKADVTRDRKS